MRLLRGDMSQDTVYNDDPAAQAHEWARAGFSWLHVVDLDGAIKGAPANSRAVRDIIKAVDLPVQLGGGIRSHAQIERWLQEGVSRVILGTAAVRDPELVRRACREFPDQIAVGIDAREGRVAVEGWVQSANITASELVKLFEDAGVAAVIYTDISRDGTGSGINVDETVALANGTSIPVIASGGVGSLADIRAVKNAGLPGVIVGKAFYNKSVDPKEALALTC